MILLAIVIFGSGCATKTPSTPESFVLSPNFERDLEIKYQELRKQGESYTNADPLYEETRKALVEGYQASFLGSMGHCQAVLLGLQLMIFEGTEKEFCESLLAVSAKDSHEFYKMFLWYKEQRDSAENFLRLLEDDSRLQSVVERSDSKELDLLSRDLGVELCYPQETLNMIGIWKLVDALNTQ